MYRLFRLVVAGLFLAGCWLTAQNLAVTNVQGESWLEHLSRSFNETSMGKTGRLGPSDMAPGDYNARGEATPLALLPPQSVTVHGADLYRMNCRGCHGESGLGVPPEINSVINPIRSTSVPLVLERMRAVGMDISTATAEEMAQQSRKALLLRLHKGGQDMPPFPHLQETEIRALVAYLKELAGVPGAQREQVSLQMPRIRIGEHIAKSTCHICHAATGSNPDPEQLLEGAIPPLSTLTVRVSLGEFVRKVTQGAPVRMGSPPILCRGRMPVFGYLSEAEAADVYLYLTLRPPEASATVAAGLVAGGPVGPNGGLYNRSSPSAGDRDDAQPVSLARFALFPIFLFLVLGGAVAKCMPLAANFHQGHEISCVRNGGSETRLTILNTRGRGGQLLAGARHDLSGHAIWSVLQPPRPQESSRQDL